MLIDVLATAALQLAEGVVEIKVQQLRIDAIVLEKAGPEQIVKYLDLMIRREENQLVNLEWWQRNLAGPMGEVIEQLREFIDDELFEKLQEAMTKPLALEPDRPIPSA